MIVHILLRHVRQAICEGFRERYDLVLWEVHVRVIATLDNFIQALALGFLKVRRIGHFYVSVLGGFANFDDALVFRNHRRCLLFLNPNGSCLEGPCIWLVSFRILAVAVHINLAHFGLFELRFEKTLVSSLSHCLFPRHVGLLLRLTVIEPALHKIVRLVTHTI